MTKAFKLLKALSPVDICNTLCPALLVGRISTKEPMVSYTRHLNDLNYVKKHRENVVKVRIKTI